MLLTHIATSTVMDLLLMLIKLLELVENRQTILLVAHLYFGLMFNL